jgi:hypothetical protein
MSIYAPLTQGITGDHSSMSQLHGGSASEESQMHGMDSGILANNMLGRPQGMAAAGFAAVVLMGVIPLAAAAFVVSRKQKSFLVAGLLVASGIILTILPLANMNFVIPGPIIGVLVGFMILGLGLAKGIRTSTTVTVPFR